MILLYILLLIKTSFSENRFICINENKSLNDMILSCKYQIIRDVCESENISIKSSSEIKNNIIIYDKINTFSYCKNVDIKINKYFIDDEYIIIYYSKPNESGEISIESKNFYDNVHKINVNTNVLKEIKNESKKIKISLDVNIDNEKILKFKNKLDSNLTKLMAYIKNKKETEHEKVGKFR